MTDCATARMLKQATGDLVAQFGKQANAGHVIDKCQQTISKFCDTDTTDNIITLPDVVRLEGAAKVPSVTRLLCKLAGGEFVKTIDPSIDETGLADHVMRCVKEVGDCADALREGRSDGVFDERDAREFVRQAEEMVAAAIALRAAGTAILGFDPRSHAIVGFGPKSSGRG